MNPVPIAVFAGVFLTAAAALVAARYLLDRFTAAEVTPEGVPQEEDIWGDAVDSPLLRAERLSTITFWNRLLRRFDWVENVKSAIGEAGLNWSVGRLTSMMLLAGTATLAVSSRFSWLSPYATLALAALAAAAPYLVVLRRRAVRLRKFEEQFPDALDSLARALRAGNSLAACMDMVAREAPAPVSAEIRKTVDERNLGVDWDRALAHLSRRVPIAEVSLFAAAVGFQARTGGKLHEVLGRLSENMREASTLKGEIRSIAAHGRMTGMVLTLLPAGIVLVMLYTSPSYLSVLWRHPHGSDMITAAVACLVLAHVVIRRLVDIRI
jgi:tight adherence protein B